MTLRSILRTVWTIFRRGAIAASTLAAALVIGLAWRSYGVADILHAGSPQAELMFTSSCGRLQVVHYRSVGDGVLSDSNSLWNFESQRPATPLDWMWPVGIQSSKTWNFGADGQLIQTPLITLPDWLLCALLLLPVAWQIWIEIRRRRRLRLGRFANCGYDIRMSGATCPECGGAVIVRG